jgi:hypothetical protein
MSLAIASEHLPLSEDADGVMRIGGTRVTLQTVVEAWRIAGVMAARINRTICRRRPVSG